MISKRLHLLFYIMINIGCKLGAFPITCNRITFTLSRSRDQLIERKTYFTKLLCIIWFFICFYVTLQKYLYGEINRLIFKMLFTITFTILITSFSVSTFYTNDVVMLINGIFEFLHYIEPKLTINEYTRIH